MSQATEGDNGHRSVPRVTAVPVVRASEKSQKIRHIVIHALLFIAVTAGPLSLLWQMTSTQVIVLDENQERATEREVARLAEVYARSYLDGNHPNPDLFPIASYQSALPESFESGSGLGGSDAGYRLTYITSTGRDLYVRPGLNGVPYTDPDDFEFWDVSFAVEPDESGPFILHVPMTLGADRKPVLAALPFMAPASSRFNAVTRRMEPVAEFLVAAGPGPYDMVPDLAGKELPQAVERWAEAYAMGNSPDLYSRGLSEVAFYPGAPVAADDLEFVGLRGFRCQDQCSEILWVSGSITGNTYARVRLLLVDVSGPSGPRGPLTVPLDADLLLANTGAGSGARVSVVSWGAPGSGPYLREFQPGM